MELKHKDSKGDNSIFDAVIELDQDMIIQPLTTIIASSQRYFVKSINWNAKKKKEKSLNKKVDNYWDLLDVMWLEY